VKTFSREVPSAAAAVPIADLGAMTEELRAPLDGVWQEITSTSSFIGGAAVDRFEEQWARYCGTRHAVGVANGTDALELILRAAGIGAGDEVIVPANTFIATLEAVVCAGARPRLVDVDEDTLMLTPDTVRAAISDRTAAVIAVELYGNMPRMAELAELASASHLALIEDAAQAHGSTWNGHRAGSFGVAGSFSFYPGKNLGAFGDGGAITTDDGALAESIRRLANHGRPSHSPDVHSIVARNSRLDALQAAVLSVKLSRLDAWNDARRTAVDTYREHLRRDRIRPLTVLPPTVSTYHQNVVRVARRDEVRSRLADLGVETKVHYPIPCHLQEPYLEYAPEPLPVVERAARDILSLPLFPHISEEQVVHVSRCLNEAVGAGP
jgi:dTDP-4-amino-4,6-dideoxygalactose transaminase